MKRRVSGTNVLDKLGGVAGALECREDALDVQGRLGAVREPHEHLDLVADRDLLAEVVRDHRGDLHVAVAKVVRCAARLRHLARLHLLVLLPHAVRRALVVAADEALLDGLLDVHRLGHHSRQRARQQRGNDHNMHSTHLGLKVLQSRVWGENKKKNNQSLTKQKKGKRGKKKAGGWVDL